MKKLGFIGGSFNPITYAHLNMANSAISKAGIDKVFFVPVGNLYEKPDLIDEKQRFEMLQLVCKNEANIDVEDIELNQKNKISTFQAFKMIEDKYKNDETDLFYIMGADNFIKLPEWKESENLIKNYKYIIFERNNVNLEDFIKNNELLNKYRDNFKIIKINEKDKEKISSTTVRKLVNENNFEKILKYTKEDVVNYIKKKDLYRKNIS